MPIESDFSGLNSSLELKMARMRRAIERSFLRAGEEAVKVAREHKTATTDYTDRTGNLRNSSGYVLLHKGEKKAEAGSSEAVELAEDYGKRIAGEYVLVVVAGMNYASYVANMGYDVLTSAEFATNSILRKLLAGLNLKEN